MKSSNVTVSVKLPVKRHQTRKPDGRTEEETSIQFDFQGVAEGIRRATGMSVSVIYGYPGRYYIPETRLLREE